MLHADLWERNADLTARIEAHPLVRALVDAGGAVGVSDPGERSASLKRAGWRSSVQSLLAIGGETLGVAAARTDDHSAFGARLVHLHERLDAEVARFQQFVADGGGDDAGNAGDAGRQRARPGNQATAADAAFVNWAREIAWRDGISLTLAVITPRLRVSGWIGQLARSPVPEVAESHPPDKLLTHLAGAGYQHLIHEAEQLLDLTAQDATDTRATYRQALAFELDVLDQLHR